MQKSIKQKKKRKGQHISKCGQYFFGQKENMSLNSIKLLCLCHVCICEQYETEGMPGENIGFLTGRAEMV